MNAVEIEEAVSELAAAPFDADEFPFAFLTAFGNKETTIRKLRSGASNKSDLGGVLQTNNIHIAVCSPGEVTKTLTALKASPATSRAKAKFALATDGETFEAEDLASGETVACAYADFPDHFGFFLPLAGITTVKQIRESSFDIRATGRLNRLYVELLKDNPDWGTAERRPDMNHFMARLIFCFFAEDTDIFNGSRLFTATIEQMSARDSANTHEVIGELFRAMNTKIADRGSAALPRWADVFPYVNGGLFSGSPDVPRFSRIAKSYLLHIGNLDWTKINPDIFGSMIQAVADDDERGALGMHYTSVPNILKVLNPLFLDDLRAQLDEARDNSRSLLNLRKRMAKIRVFDPACGSGNFLVIAYKAMREIEAEINKRRGEADRRTEIPLTNFRGIELRDFPAEVARLALIIAEFQCDVLYRGQKEALAEFLPLDAMNWITCGNALRLDWLSVCPPTGTGVKFQADDLFHTPLDQAQIDFENEGGETYICGNPPYKGSQSQDDAQKADLELVFRRTNVNWKGTDYVGGWFKKASDYCGIEKASFAFVSTNSICQGKAVSNLWPNMLGRQLEIQFAYTSFRWANLANYNAGVTVVVVGVGPRNGAKKHLFVTTKHGLEAREVPTINAYLVSGPELYVNPRSENLSGLNPMVFGNMPIDGGGLSFTTDEIDATGLSTELRERFIRRIYGGAEFVRGQSRYCLWIEDDDIDEVAQVPGIKDRLEKVEKFRRSSARPATLELAQAPHRFGWVAQAGSEVVTLLPRILSERREYITVGHEPAGTLTTDQAYALFDAPLWNMALIASRIHLVWITTVCGKLKTDLRYSNTLGWNTFPVPTLTEKNKADLTRCAEDILLARGAHFPATVAELYDPEAMPDELRAAHDRNDETLERIYIGRRFRNDTERLEKLFDLYTKMTTLKKASA
ncbi:class I SAM-dependent DNA methyltransferase [Mesorhizobium mediterraneum]|uniref:class I SAM-dependent DNA methyltransferase n=1 Tax=Mesorhizobium mediterraneum TaxID=43617 RepID=UPI001780DD68|nr:class I SAM-dependent DNA methyltransferase [Mesorhizobium mediterraneum]